MDPQAVRHTGDVESEADKQDASDSDYPLVCFELLPWLYRPTSPCGGCTGGVHYAIESARNGRKIKKERNNTIGDAKNA